MSPRQAREAALAVLAARQQLLGGKSADLGDAIPLRLRLDPVWRERHLYQPTMRAFRRRARA